METKVPGSMDVPDFTSVPVPFMSTTQARADLWRRRLSCQNIVTRQAVRTRQVNPMLQASVQAFHVELTGHPAVCLVLSFSLSASTICMLSPLRNLKSSDSVGCSTFFPEGLFRTSPSHVQPRARNSVMAWSDRFIDLLVGKGGETAMHALPQLPIDLLSR